ncbi:helix-turn-helix transcriptional regulator [Lactobacillus sp. ESL0228]|uniref:helix-turn-helix domain-containing protein n=1 Tax=Lactobacillus sp. ESL0228 TaxID=2069352 RepID=UPI000EFBF57B|nr:helix-turn-helix transcriptional regulator [Lactobacillus sp. ESL0228]RMC48928.1 XRE family transcriptional regulator [Lactobacillus sp. ESL0228]
MWEMIQKIMDKKKISIYKLSKLTGLPWSTINNYRNGSEMSFTNACKIADALEISLDELREKKLMENEVKSID